MESKKILDLKKYLGSSSTTFTDRDWGENARVELKLDKLEKEFQQIIITIPKKTTSLNPSFYLGLLFESYKILRPDGFKEKYVFKFEDSSSELIPFLKEDLDDGERQAIDELNSNYGI